MVSEHVNRKHSWEGYAHRHPYMLRDYSHDFGHTSSKQLLDRQVCAGEMITVFINPKS